MGKPAQDLTKAIRDYLTLSGWHVSRNGADSGKRKGGFYRVANADIGRSDLEAHKYIPAVPAFCDERGDAAKLYWICVEIKAGRDTLKSAQEQWLANAQKHGAIVVIARSLQDVIDATKELN